MGRKISWFQRCVGRGMRGHRGTWEEHDRKFRQVVKSCARKKGFR